MARDIKFLEMEEVWVDHVTIIPPYENKTASQKKGFIGAATT